LDEKLVKVCQKLFEEYVSKSSSSLETKDDFDGRKDLLKNITIKENEVIKCVAPIHTGNWGVTRNGLLVATNLRIFVLFKKGLGGADVHTFYYNKIVSIDYKKTFLASDLTISTNGDKELTIACFSSDTLANLLRDFMEEATTKRDTLQSTELNSVVEQLEKLHNLKQSGAISEEEYNILKQKLIKS
jgi:Bacterial PH domain/Short C-terminal domain